VTRPPSPVSSASLAALATFDTPTICNALEVVDARFRLTGYTREPLLCTRPELKPIVGFARTATIRSAAAPAEPREAVKAKRLAYYEYVAKGGPLPAVVAIEDLDGPLAGLGAFWGEVNTHVHRGLGALGVVTNGSVRDLDANATGFQLLAGRVTPSHAHVHVAGFGERVRVAGLEIASGDLVHADRHGAAVIPVDLVQRVLDAVALLQRREGVILAAARAEGFDFEKLARAIRDADEIH
jgi:regulator of RNase E activity RraA